MQPHTTGVINMKEEQFEVVVMVGVRFSLAVESCDSEFVLDDILTENLGGRCEVNPDWEDAERTGINYRKDFGTYKVTGTYSFEDNAFQEGFEYTTTWEKIA
jgi:hypothetical protein